jgi:simple sugar transport system ATP-binding protein
LLVSGDLREVLSLADTILVIFRGQVMDIISAENEQAIERIGPLMAGVKAGK